MLKRTATAQWTGPLKDGKGTITTASKTLNNTNYSFHSRFEAGQGTNPEELLAAAHAGCFSMAFNFAMEQQGIKAASVHTEATVSLDQVPGGFAIAAIHLKTTAKVPGANAAKIKEIAEGAKAGCPVSKALASVKITMDATIEV